MNKEIEEAKRTLVRIRNIYEHIKNYGWVNDVTRDVEPNKAIQSIETVLQELENSIPKEVIKEKKENLEKQYKEALEVNSTQAFILKCQLEILEEILKEGRK